MREGPQRYARRGVKAIGSIDLPMSAAIAIHRRINGRLASNLRDLVFADESGSIYAVSDDSQAAVLTKPWEIIGTYTRTADPADIAADIEAWRDEFHVERAA